MNDDGEDIYRKRQEIIERIVKARGQKMRYTIDPDPPQRDAEGYECAHCGNAFEIGSKHYTCANCGDTVCYPGCSQSSCPGYGEGYTVFTPDDIDE